GEAVGASGVGEGSGCRRGAHRLTPGDIVRITPTDTTARLLRGIQERGLTVGRLEDYL
ncbi:hypothetical protein JHN45_49340, partial [Streptomyces sp. MBT53]|nr:hypothetical protein [Streptomyces sp. MBT53]